MLYARKGNAEVAAFIGGRRLLRYGVNIFILYVSIFKVYFMEVHPFVLNSFASFKRMFSSACSRVLGFSIRL